MSSRRSFFSGVAAGCAFAVVMLLGRALASVPTLPELLQDRLVLLLPGQIFAFFLDRLLYLGKPLLFGSMLLALLGLGGVVGLVVDRWQRLLLLTAGFWLVTGFIVLPLAGQGIFADSIAVALVLFAAFAAYAIAFAGFAGTWRVLGWGPKAAADAAVAAAESFDRRRLLTGGVLGLAAAALAWLDIGRLPELPARGGSIPSGGAALQPGASDAAAATPGLPPAVTPPDKFYIVSKNLLDPQVNARRWRLRIDGLVDHVLTLSYDDLLALPAVQMQRTLECISNEVGGDLISNGLWTGTRLSDLLQRAGVHSDATALQFTSADGYTASMPLQQAQDPITLLAYRLGDGPLPAKHGYPVRVLGTGTYGMKNPKWLTRIQVVRSSQPGFWQQQGWDEQGIVQTMAQIHAPDDGATLASGAVNIAGIAFAGNRGVTRVEVSTDGGSAWDGATLLPSLGANTWMFWQYGWTPPHPGSYTILSRATDGTGAVQPQRKTDPFPAGATGYHQVRVRVTG